jgi:hypothetical protein
MAAVHARCGRSHARSNMPFEVYHTDVHVLSRAWVGVSCADTPLAARHAALIKLLTGASPRRGGGWYGPGASPLSHEWAIRMHERAAWTERSRLSQLPHAVRRTGQCGPPRVHRCRWQPSWCSTLGPARGDRYVGVCTGRGADMREDDPGSPLSAHRRRSLHGLCMANTRRLSYQPARRYIHIDACKSLTLQLGRR